MMVSLKKVTATKTYDVCFFIKENVFVFNQVLILDNLNFICFFDRPDDCTI
jgi:hypothetical protein